MRLKTYLTTCIGRLYKRMSKSKYSVWIEVPISCRNMAEKDNIIHEAIEIMERKITVKNK